MQRQPPAPQPPQAPPGPEVFATEGDVYEANAPYADLAVSALAVTVC